MVIIDVGGERHSAERNCLLRYPTTRYDWRIDHFVQMIEEMRIEKTFCANEWIDHQKAEEWKNTTGWAWSEKRPQLQRDGKDRYSAINKISKKGGMVYFRF